MKIRTKIWIYPLAIIGVLIMLSTSCKKKDHNNNSSPAAGTVTDKDGNVYHTVTIGTQVWMVENLKTTKYNDGTSIQLVTDNTSWIQLNTPGYCWYDNDAANKNTYGALYNWFVVGTGKLAPKGWHVPTDAEWTILTDFLGGDTSGGKMKEAGTVHWAPPNEGATNSSGFSALPAGNRHGYGYFANMGIYTTMWSSTENHVLLSYARSLSWNIAAVFRNTGEKIDGYSVRCVRD